MSQSEKEIEKQLKEDRLIEKSENAIILGAGISHHGLGVRDALVSHTTANLEHVYSILNDGIKLKSHPNNLYGGNSFYVAEKGFSIHQVPGDYTLALSLSNKVKIYDATQAYEASSQFASLVKALGKDAIRYEGDYLINKQRYSYNLAIINNPEHLKPIGIYPTPPEPHPSAFSVPTIRSIQVLGLLGGIYSSANAVIKVIQSDSPIETAFQQITILGAAAWGGMLGGSSALLPCATLGAATGPAAPFTIPICIASASALSGMIAAATAEFTWDAVSSYLSETDGSYMLKDMAFHFCSLTSRTMAGSLSVDSVSGVMNADRLLFSKGDNNDLFARLVFVSLKSTIEQAEDLSALKIASRPSSSATTTFSQLKKAADNMNALSSPKTQSSSNSASPASTSSSSILHRLKEAAAKMDGVASSKTQPSSTSVSKGSSSIFSRLKDASTKMDSLSCTSSESTYKNLKAVRSSSLSDEISKLPKINYATSFNPISSTDGFISRQPYFWSREFDASGEMLADLSENKQVNTDTSSDGKKKCLTDSDCDPSDKDCSARNKGTCPVSKL